MTDRVQTHLTMRSAVRSARQEGQIMAHGSVYRISPVAGTSSRRGVLIGSGLTLLLGLGSCSNSGVGPSAVAGLTPDGTIEMRQVQAAFIGSGGGGGGTLFYRGRSYPFTVAGLGVGGIGASTIDADGEVYRISDIAAFPGAYVQGRYGLAIGPASAGDLWLQNKAGVILHLRAKRKGLMLSLGGDAVLISMQ